MRKNLLFIALGACVFLFAPWGAARAFEVTLESVTPDATEIEIPSNPPEEGTVEDTLGLQYTQDLGTEFTAVINLDGTDDETDLAPLVIATGAKVLSYDYDATAKQMTIVYEGDEFVIPNDSEPTQLCAFAFVMPNEDPTRESPNVSGPPASMASGYVSTNVLQWSITPPSGPEDMGFGLTLTGTAGDSSYFKMYMPATMLELMSTMSGQEITADDLALFLDGYQTTLEKTVTDDGGILFNVNFTFTSTNNTVNSLLTSRSASSSVTRTFLAQEREDLSLAITKRRIAKNTQIKLYGWLKGNQVNNKEIKVFRKKVGASRYRLVTTLTTQNENGYYYYKFKPTEAGTYYYRVKNGNGQKASSRVRLRVTE